MAADCALTTLVFFIIFVRVPCAGQVTPENLIVKIGDPILLLSHFSGSSETEWLFESKGDKLSKDSKLSNGVAARGYYLTGDSADEEYNLNVDSATAAHAGEYINEISNPSGGKGKGKGKVEYMAQVVVVDGDVKCDGTMVDATDGSTSAMNGQAVVGDTLRMDGNLPYWGDWPTLITCTSGEFTYTTHADTSTAGVSSYTYEYVVNSLGSVSCTAVLPASTSALIPADTATDFYATNIPDFSSTCSADITDLLYPPQSCTMTPSKYVYVEGDVIVCSADANPAATYEWFLYPGGSSVATGASLTISSALGSEFFDLRCVATNTIRATDTSYNCRKFGAYVSTSTTSTTTTTPSPAVDQSRMIDTYDGLPWWALTIIALLAFLAVMGVTCLIAYKCLENCWRCQGNCMAGCRACRVECRRCTINRANRSRSGYKGYGDQQQQQQHQQQQQQNSWTRWPNQMFHKCCGRYYWDVPPMYPSPYGPGPGQPQQSNASKPRHSGRPRFPKAKIMVVIGPR